MANSCFKLTVVITLFFGALNVVTAQNNPNSQRPDTIANIPNPALNNWGPPYPFTAEVIQDKLIQVLKIPGDELSREKVETIFGMKMVNSDEVAPESLNVEPGHPDKNIKWYKVSSRPGVDWYFFLGVTVVPDQTFFGFAWLDLGKPMSSSVVLPMCIKVQQFSEAIEHANTQWKLIHLPLERPLDGYVDTSVYFTRSGNIHDFNSLRIEYMVDSNCLTALSFQINARHGN